MKKIFLLLILFSYSYSDSFCQDKYFVSYLLDLKGEPGVGRSLRKNTESYVTKELALMRIESGIAMLRQEGYLEANLDSVYLLNDTIYAVIHTGKKYKWNTFRLKSESLEGMPGKMRHNYCKKGRDARFIDLQSFQKEVLDYLANNGYPFAQLKVEEIVIRDDEIAGSIEVVPNAFIVWDSIVVKGEPKVKAKFIQRYLGITPGKAYKEDISKFAGKKLNNLSFVREIKPSEIEFGKDKAKLYTYLEKATANQFDGIAGLQSNKEDSKIEFTGEVKLLLKNAFGAGERINFKWVKLEKKSQSLQLGFVYPYLFSSSLGADIGFKIQKKDTTYLSRDFKVGIRYSQLGRNYFKLFFSHTSSSLLATSHLKTLTVLPDFADVKSYSLNLGYHFEDVDNAFNPREGLVIDLNAGIGEHKLKKNSSIPEKVYEGVKLSKPLFESVWELEYNLKLQKNFSLRIKNIGGIKESKHLFQNDLFRIGGLSTIRGFNQNSFLASAYTVFRTELRFIPQQNSSYYLFWDGAYYQNGFLQKRRTDYPWGIGFGLNFATKSGIFTLNYAVGKQNNKSVDLKAAKVHFGYVSRF